MYKHLLPTYHCFLNFTTYYIMKINSVYLSINCLLAMKKIQTLIINAIVLIINKRFKVNLNFLAAKKMFNIKS